MAVNMGLTCPKCGGAMRTYERNGVTVDQCAECRGLFLDRGELERLIDAEGSYYEDRRDEPRREERRPEESGHKKKRKGFLSEFLEFGE